MKTNNEIAKEFRKARQLSQLDFAKLLKVQRYTVISWERPVSDPAHRKTTNQTVKMIELIKKLDIIKDTSCT